jgi:exopolysaccharide production protein ExoQ
MNPSLATLVYALGIAGLFYLNRDKSARTSGALWIPVIWFWILGSRAVSIWLGLSSASKSAAMATVMMDGSPIDAFIFQALLACALVVLVRRGPRCVSLMRANWPIVWYFLYCLMSVVWSDYPDVAGKRWIKATGDVVIALVVLTEAQPAVALRRLFSRAGFLLVPASTLLIKYYPYLGRGFDAWSGAPFNTGVTTDKNMLGVSTYILALGALWQVLRLWRDSDLPNRSRQLLAQCTLLGFGVWNLFTANSATSESCFMLAASLMLVTGFRRFRGRPSAVQALVLKVMLLGCLIKATGADAVIFQVLGRKPDLTGRADIWPVLLRMAPNALIGAGFESFWLGPRLQRVFDAFPNLYVSEAHNGYLESYLNLGAAGVTLIVVILVNGYRSSLAALRIDPESGNLMLAYVLTAAIYSYTEAGFRMLDYEWSFLIMLIIAAARISSTYRRSGNSIARDLQANSVEQVYYSSPSQAAYVSR